MPSIALPSELSALAARQHGVVSTRQCQAAGLTSRQLRYRAGNIALVPFIGSTYLVAGAPVTANARYFGSALAVEGSVVSVFAAAHVHGLPGYGAADSEVMVAAKSGHGVPGVLIRRRDDLLDRHRCEVDGLPVTTIPRTVLDLAAYVPWLDVAKLVDELVERRRLTIPRLFDEFDRIARRGRNGTRSMRIILEPRLVGSAMTNSELERRGLEFLSRHGFPVPVVEFRPPWAGPAVARVDLAYPDQRVVIELDGRKWHDRSDRFEGDRLRDQLAMSYGWIVVRITWRQLVDDPRGVARRLRAILSNRSLAAS